MKFKVLRSQFIEGLKSVQNIVAGKGSLPILQNVMIEGKGNSIKLTTTDLDISIKSEVECEVIEEGTTTLPVKLLFTSVTKAAEGVVVVECDGQERATIKAGSARFKLQGMPGSVLFLDHQVVQHGLHVFPVFCQVFAPELRLFCRFCPSIS